KYVLPFVIACIVLACTQATGINSILAYAVVILKQAGLDDVQASQGNTLITVLNCAMTIVGAALVDRVGRKFLLKTGTGGIIVALLAGAFLYRHFESQRVDVDAVVSRQISADGRSLSVRVDEATLGRLPGGQAAQLNVLYRYDDGQGHKRQDVATAFSNVSDESARMLVIKPKTDDKGRVIDLGKLIIERAKYGPIPSATTGWLITGILCLFIASFSVGPGVCVWLALTELMPTRIRSMGMGIAMLLNSGVSFLIALVFLPTVGYYGYSAMFFFWAGCTVIYFITAAFFMPETKGKTLEEIEDYFEGKKKT
ncbi:MAG: MFS transporter, partial [Verrucomicrobia bacterium]|nr:MFS transporter [Verrucomicrobiota bacterium]